jgi:hypothetical protein
MYEAMRLLAVLLAFVVFQVWWFHRETPTEKRLAAVAGSIAERDDAAIRCPSIWRRAVEISSFGGNTHFDTEGKPDFAELRHEVCATFEDLPEKGFPSDVDCLLGDASRCDGWTKDVLFAVHVLSHEAWHLAGVRDEATAECYAYQTDAAVAEEFGATPSVARRVAAYLLSQGTRSTLPEYRISSDCRSGGKLDLHPGTAAWPSS